MKHVIVLALFSLPLCAFALSADADFPQMIGDRQFADAEKLANERINSNPKDDVAVWYLALRAEVHIYEKEFDKAESLLSTIRPACDEVGACAAAGLVEPRIRGDQ